MEKHFDRGEMVKRLCQEARRRLEHIAQGFVFKMKVNISVIAARSTWACSSIRVSSDWPVAPTPQRHMYRGASDQGPADCWLIQDQLFPRATGRGWVWLKIRRPAKPCLDEPLSARPAEVMARASSDCFSGHGGKSALRALRRHAALAFEATALLGMTRAMAPTIADQISIMLPPV